MDPLTAQPAAVGANRQRARGAPPPLSFAARFDWRAISKAAKQWQSGRVGVLERTRAQSSGENGGEIFVRK